MRTARPVRTGRAASGSVEAPEPIERNRSPSRFSYDGQDWPPRRRVASSHPPTSWRCVMRAALLTLIVLAAVACGLILAPAGLASPGSDSAIVAIGQLEAQGYDVRIDRIGSAPLSECQVTSVRNPQEQTRLVRVDGHRDRDRFIEVVVNRTITVSLDCSSR